MNIKYKIIKIDPKEHCIVVRFYTDILTEEKLSAILTVEGLPVLDENGKVKQCRTDVNLALWQVPAPTGKELEDYILKNAPIAWFKLQEQILDPNVDTSMSDLMPLLGIENTVTAQESVPLINKLT